METKTSKQPKPILWLVGVVIALVVGGTLATRHVSAGLPANSKTANNLPAGAPALNGMPNAPGWENLTKELKLNPTQATQLRPLVDEYLGKWMDLRKEYSLKARTMLAAAAPKPLPPSTKPEDKTRPQAVSARVTPQLQQNMMKLRTDFRNDAQTHRKAMLAKATFLSGEQQKQLDTLFSNPRYTFMMARATGRMPMTNSMGFRSNNNNNLDVKALRDRLIHQGMPTQPQPQPGHQ